MPLPIQLQRLPDHELAAIRDALQTLQHAGLNEVKDVDPLLESLKNKVNDDNTDETAEMQYDKAFHKIGGTQSLKDHLLDSMMIASLVKENLKPGEVPWEQDLIYQGLDTRVLLRDAEIAFQSFSNACDHIKSQLEAEELEVDAMIAPLKGIIRSNTKVTVKFAGDLRQLSDVLRATLQIKANGEKTLSKIYTALLKAVRKPPAGVQYLFFHDRYQTPLRGGYRDLLFILRVNGMLCELQVNVDVMLIVKEGAGHNAYEVIRLNNDSMLAAAQADDANTVKQHLNKKADPNYQTSAGFSPLFYASLHGNKTMTHLLCKAGADVFKTDTTGCIPLNRAADLGKVEVAAILAKYMAAECNDPCKPMLLMDVQRRSVIKAWATVQNKIFANSNDASVTEFSRDLQQVFDRVTGGIDAALGLSAMACLASECNTLLEKGAQVNCMIATKGSEWECCCDGAAKAGSVATVRVLVSHGGHLGYFQRGCAKDLPNIAIGAGYEAMLAKILENDMGSELDAFLEAQEDWVEKEELLIKAADLGALKICGVLLRRGTSARNLSSQQVAKLARQAVNDDDSQAISLLIARGASSFEDCGGSVREAAKANQKKGTLKLLAQAGCPLDEPGDEDWTPMAIAARDGNISIIKCLHAEGCSLDTGSCNTATPLAWAVVHGRVTSIVTLKELGADIHAPPFYDPSQDGQKLLGLAALSSQSECIRVLSSLKCDVNDYQHGGMRPVHQAVIVNAAHAVTTLAELKADLCLCDKSGNVPAFYASPESDMLKKLRELGATEEEEQKNTEAFKDS